jgi:predicted phosphodiesterase
VAVSDFHAPRSFVTADDLAKAVNGAECDALFILGDTIDDSTNLGLVTGLFKNIQVCSVDSLGCYLTVVRSCHH